MTLLAIDRLARSLWNLRWFLFMLGLAGTVSAAFTYTLIQTDIIYPVVRTLRLQEYEGAGTVDKRLNIYYKFERRRECQTAQLRWLWQWREVDGHRVQFVVPLDMSMVPISNVGPGQVGELVVSYAMPSGIDPGDWFFVTKTMDFCGLLAGIVGPTFRTSPDVPVHLEFATDKHGDPIK